MSYRTTRNSKRTVAALAAFGVVASAFAIASPVSADLAEVPGAGGIRVEPTFPAPFGLNQDQPAPVLQNGVSDQEAASTQILFHNGWVSGDRILVQLFDSADNNCSSVPTSIGYSVEPEVTVSGPADFDPGIGSPWGPNNGSPDVAFSFDNPQPIPVAAPAPTVPTFNTNLLQSTGCAANGINDILEIQFTNASSGATPTDAWVFTIDGVVLDVGAAVAGGPIHQVPFGQNARPGIPAYENTIDLFSGNQSALQSGVPVVINEWTVPAFVAPITLTSENADALVGDGFAQNLGDVTLTETQIDAFATGFYGICFGPGIDNIREELLEVTTSGAGVTVDPFTIFTYSNFAFNDCIQFNLTASTATALDSVTISGIFGDVNSGGTKSATLDFVPPAFEAAYLFPDDQTTGVGPYTDVNLGELDAFTTELGTATSLPDRIGGADRYDTAAKIAYSTEECATFAVLVNGESYPDSLSASYLAGALTLADNNDEDEVPILTTPGSFLHPAAELAIRELGVRTVYIVGGPAAVSEEVEAAVEALPRTECGGDISDTTQTVQVTRFGGMDRYDTNQLVVENGQSILDSDSVDYNDRIRYQANAGESSQRTAIVASGANFADALAAGPISFGDDDYGFPLVLTTPDELSAEAASTLTNLDITQVIIVGGEAAVSADVATSLEELGIDVIRRAGADRYETAIQVLLWAGTPEFPNTSPVLVGGDGFNLGLGWSLFGDVVLARGDNFADALAVAPYVGGNEDLLVLTQPTSLPPAAGAFISTLAGLGINPDIIAIGLGSAISDSVLVEANALANP